MASLPRFVLLDKAVGQTPLQAIERWKEAHPACADVPATYAGRLDPMASGKLLVLLGEERTRQERYRGLDKEYEIEVLLDLSTDTGDVLGMPSYPGIATAPGPEEVRAAVLAQHGTKTLPYPAFSSKTVHGKPLFLHALEDTLDSIAIPTHEETIYAIREQGYEHLSKEQLRERLMRILELAPRSLAPSKEPGADFRQDAIRTAWAALFEAMPARTFVLLSLRVSCGSGTYMRTLSTRIASELGTSGMTLSIRRTRLGKYRKIGPIRFWDESQRMLWL